MQQLTLSELSQYLNRQPLYMDDEGNSTTVNRLFWDLDLCAQLTAGLDMLVSDMLADDNNGLNQHRIQLAIFGIKKLADVIHQLMPQRTVTGEHIVVDRDSNEKEILVWRPAA